MDISKRLKDIRTSMDYTLSYVEKETGINKGTLSKYENDKGKPSYENLIKLANFYNVSLDKLCAQDINLVSESDESYNMRISNELMKIINTLLLPQNKKFTNYIIKDPERRIKAISESYFRTHSV